MFETILCATDGSHSSDRALRYARQLTEAYGGSLRVVHVAAPAHGWYGGGDEEPVVIKLKSQVSSLRRHGLDASLHVIRGGDINPARHIAETAAAVDADLVLAGTHGRSPLAAGPLGSTTKGLLHTARCPVLVVPGMSEAPAELTQAAPGAAQRV